MRLASAFLYLVNICLCSQLHVDENLTTEISKLNAKIKNLAQFGLKNGEYINTISHKLQDIHSLKDLVQKLGLSFRKGSNSSDHDANNPFIPKLDETKNLFCTRNSTFNNLCTEDPSYPKWYTSLISTEVQNTLTSLSDTPSVNAYACGKEPDNKCESVKESLALTTVQIQANIARDQSPSGPQFAFALNTLSFTQTLISQKCLPDQQTCPSKTDPHQTYPCKNVGSGPPHYPVRQLGAANEILIINDKGLVDIAKMTEPDPMLVCWCMCYSDP